MRVDEGLGPPESPAIDGVKRTHTVARTPAATGVLSGNVVQIPVTVVVPVQLCNNNVAVAWWSAAS